MNKLYTITSLFIIIISISAFKNSDSSIEIIKKNDMKRFENFYFGLVFVAIVKEE